MTRKRAGIKSKKTFKRNKSRVLPVITIIIIIAISGAALTLYDFPEEDQKGDNISNDGEDFTFTALDGSEKHLSDYRGKVVILDMWATWCGPCEFQMNELKKIYENYSRNDLEILSIDIDTRETLDLIQSYKSYFGLNWIFGLDTEGVWDKYKLKDEGVPTVYIFDQEGNVYCYYEGISVYIEIPDGWPSYLDPPPKLGPKIDELLD